MHRRRCFLAVGGQLKQLGGSASLAPEGKPQPSRAQIVLKNPRAGTRVIHREHHRLGFAAAGVVKHQLCHHGGQQPLAHAQRAVFIGIGNGPEGRVHGEAQPLRVPLVGSPAVRAFELAGLERLGVRLYVLLGRSGLFHQKSVCRAADRAHIKWQALERCIGVTVPLLESYEDFLIAGLANL